MEINGTSYNAELDDILQELKSQLDLNGSTLFSKGFKDSGDNTMCQCIYHANGQERRPSAGIKKSTGVYHCFTCGETHSLPEVISHCFGYDDFGLFGKQWLLKNFASISIENRRDLNLDLQRTKGIVDTVSNKFVSEQELDKYRYYHPYWTKRGIVDDKIIELFDLGYDESTKCITMPVRDSDGNCLFVARRSINMKWFNYPKGINKPLYGIWELKQLSNYPTEVLVCESIIDCLTAWQYGRPCVALNGTGDNLQFKQLQELPCRKLVLCTDMDEAGLKARKKIRDNVKNKIVTELIWDVNKAKDLNDMDADMFKSLQEVF